MAFDDFKDDEAWIAVAKYLHGPSWRTLGKVIIEEEDPEEVVGDGNNEDGEIANGDHDRATAAGGDELISLHQHINQIIPNENDGQLVMQALDFIKVYVGYLRADEGEGDQNSTGDEQNNDEAESNTPPNPLIGVFAKDEEEAKGIANDMNIRLRKAVLEILSEHVKLSHRKKSVSKQDLIGWLQQNNTIRNFWFYTSAGLKELMSAKGIVLKGRKTAEEMRLALAHGVNERVENNERRERLEAMSPKDSATMAILQKSFLPHQKGKAREYCSLGHHLEIPILNNWIQTVTGFVESPVIGMQIKGAYKAGLAAKKGAEFAKDSIDFILSVVDPDASEDGAEESVVKIWGFEAKGRVTAKTAAEEERHLHLLNDPHIRIDEKEVFEEVSSKGERFQVIQHAYVYDLDTVVLAISDNQASLIRSTIIDYSAGLKGKFGKVLNDIKDFSLDWAYPQEVIGSTRRANKLLKVPDRILEFSNYIPTINDPHTLHATANIWFSLSRLQKPFPSFLRLIPAIYAYWNAVKGGSDTTSKLMDDCILRIPKLYLNTETCAIARLLSIIFVAIHRLHQLFTANPNLDSTYASCLQNYREASSDRSTYYVSLLSIKEIIDKQIDNAEQENTHREAPILQRGPIRVNPSRHRIDGMIPSSFDCAPQLQTKTPTKITKITTSGVASVEIERMLHNCTGMPLKAYPATDQQRCDTCGAKTAWYCAGCKRYFCMERRVKVGNKLPFELYSHKIKGKKKTFQQLCFHKAHERAWRRHTADESNQQQAVVVTPRPSLAALQQSNQQHN